jgi:ABC-type sugar transport system substrate-binding protein
VLLQLQRLITQGIVTIIIDDELKEPEGLYCIPPNEHALGRVAGELIEMITPGRGTVLVSEGRENSKIHTNKIKSMVDYFKEKNSQLSVQVVKGYSNRPETDDCVYESLKKALGEYPDVVACYALTSHDNILMVKAVRDMGLAGQISIIGTDLNDTTAQLLRGGELKAIINQGAYMKGYSSLGILTDCIIKHMDPPRRVDCPIDIVLQGNLRFYEHSNNIIVWR